MDNLILMTDSYKASHFLQYPPQTTSMYSYVESRGGTYPETVFFGLQYILERYLSQPINMGDVVEAQEFFAAHGEPFPLDGWRRVVEHHNGYIPLKIRAVPEGSVVPNHNVLMDVESTDEKLFWMVTWLETLLMRVWYPITVASQSYAIKKTIRNFLENTSDAPDAELLFKLHDFGARGVSSHESAALGGAAHLVNFQGSDTIEGLMLARDYYDEHMAGFSVPATEHSTMTAWGRAGEMAAYENALHVFGTNPIVSVVSDSYDIMAAIDQIWGGSLKEQVLAFNKAGGTLVIRFDSGEPIDRIILEGVERLDAAFGHTLNTKGYKVLKGVRALQGDGINQKSIYDILSTLTNNGWSASNIGTFGMGGALLQQVNRDTQKFAYKCSSVVVAGTRRDIFKQPITDLGKQSKKGRLDLIMHQGHYKTVEHGNSHTLLEPVYLNGAVLRRQTLSEIRENTVRIRNAAAVV